MKGKEKERNGKERKGMERNGKRGARCCFVPSSTLPPKFPKLSNVLANVLQSNLIIKVPTSVLQMNLRTEIPTNVLQNTRLPTIRS